ncbi:uncharacterized protein [Littorina saxatilis]|uniref:Uncharacterized protein n=1 Tax=Littorina saxatilis TaxID=31220 RepID=A0AAN9BDF1_9CAEN
MEVLTEGNVRIVTVVICSVLSFCALLVIVSLSLILSTTGGNCILYAHSTSYGSDALCSFPIAIATIFLLLYCLARAVFIVVALRGIFGKEYIGHKVFLIVCTVVDVISCLLTLVSGGLISHGFNVMCSEVFKPHPDKCGSLDIYIPATNSFLKHYHLRLNIAEAGVWLGWVLWLLLILCDMFHVWKADLLSASSLPFSMPSWPIRGRQQTGSKATKGRNDSEASSERDIQQPQGSSKYFFRPRLAEGGSGSRTPPPSRPVPKRPEGPPKGVMMTKY